MRYCRAYARMNEVHYEYLGERANAPCVDVLAEGTVSEYQSTLQISASTTIPRPNVSSVKLRQRSWRRWAFFTRL